MQLDHIAIWVADPLKSIEFFTSVVGLELVAGQRDYPAVRINDDSIIDLVPKSEIARIEAIPGAAGTAGHVVNHICLAMTKDEFEALRERLKARGIKPGHAMENQTGARGIAPKAFYFKDLDGNIFEARYY